MVMRTVRENIIVDATPERIWDILVDPYYTPKLFPDILNMKADPPGRVVIGQKRTLSGRAGRRLVEFHTEVSNMEPGRRFEIVGRPGGALEQFEQTIELVPVGGKTQIRAVFTFKVSESYFGPEFDIPTLEQMVIRNEHVYLENLKQLSELTPLK